MFDPERGVPCALEVRILRFIYENGPSSIEEFHEKSGYRAEGHLEFAALEGFRDAAQKNLIGIDDLEKFSAGSRIRYKALIEPDELRSMLVRNAVNAAFEAQTPEFRELMAEFAKLSRD